MKIYYDFYDSTCSWYSHPMKMSSVKEVGARIANERKALGLTQSQLAERIGISRGRLASYEDGRGCLRCGIAFNICRNLVLSEQWLATGDGDKDLYLDVSLLFPEEFLDKPFLELYAEKIDSIYKVKAEKTNEQIHFLWSISDHPETLELATLKHQRKFASRITDPLSLVYFWMKIAGYAKDLSDDYSLPPRHRNDYLNDRRIELEDGSIIPFSYERFFDDLKLIGLMWVDIEGIATEVTFDHGPNSPPIPIAMLKRTVFLSLQGIDRDSSHETTYAELYKKLHMREDG